MKSSQEEAKTAIPDRKLLSSFSSSTDEGFEEQTTVFGGRKGTGLDKWQRRKEAGEWQENTHCSPPPLGPGCELCHPYFKVNELPLKKW